MARLIVTRDPTGRISRVAKELTGSENAVFLVLVVGLAIAMGSAALHMAGKGHWLRVPELAIAVGCLAYVASEVGRRLLSHRSKPTEIADVRGVRFVFYSELGLVPWTAVVGFHVESFRFPGYGGAVLVADFADPRSWIAELRPANAVAPGKRFAPPFPSVDMARSLDLRALKAALEDLLAQSRA